MSYLILLGLLFVLVLSMVYTRYVPVSGVSDAELIVVTDPSTVCVDVRMYQISHKDSVQDAVNIPVGYLNRYYKVIEKKNVHIIADTKLNKNLSIRFLRKKGFTVTNYSLVNNPLENKVRQ